MSRISQSVSLTVTLAVSIIFVICLAFALFLSIGATPAKAADPAWPEYWNYEVIYIDDQLMLAPTAGPGFPTNTEVRDWVVNNGGVVPLTVTYSDTTTWSGNCQKMVYDFGPDPMVLFKGTAMAYLTVQTDYYDVVTGRRMFTQGGISLYGVLPIAADQSLKWTDATHYTMDTIMNPPAGVPIDEQHELVPAGTETVVTAAGTFTCDKVEDFLIGLETGLDTHVFAPVSPAQLKMTEWRDQGGVGLVKFVNTGYTQPETGMLTDYGPKVYNLTYTAGSNGTLTGNTSQTVNEGTDGTPVTAVPNTGYTFVDWSDSSTANPRTDTNVSSDISVTANFAAIAPTTYNLTYAAGANGTLTGDTSQTVNSGENGTPVTAVPNTGYEFVNWSDTSTANPRTDTNVTSNLSVTANFAAIAPTTYNLTYAAGANGTLTGDASQTVNSGEDGTAVTAVPDTGYHFVNWSDSSTANPRTDTNVTSNVSVTANFAIDSSTYNLTYTAGANGTLTGNASQTVNSGEDGTAVTAVPDTGYHFVNWSDSSTANPRTDTNVTSNVSVTANFAIDSSTYNLTYTAGPNGTLTGDASQTVNSGEDGTAVTAVPDTGYHFVSWSDSSTANPRMDTGVMADINVTANFAMDNLTYNLTYTAGPNGTLTGNTSQTVNSGEDGTAVTAVPNTGYTFVDWSDSSMANPRTDTNVSSDISVTANFAEIVSPTTPEEAIGELRDTIEGYNLDKGISNGFAQRLGNALKSLTGPQAEANKHKAAINMLEAFINTCEAQSGKKLTADQADSLIAMANAIIELLKQP